MPYEVTAVCDGCGKKGVASTEHLGGESQQFPLPKGWVELWGYRPKDCEECYLNHPKGHHTIFCSANCRGRFKRNFVQEKEEE
jgi:hypothetical protein